MNLHSLCRPSLALTALAASLLTACACAQPAGTQDRHPPPEALAACKAAAAGTACTFTSPRGEVTGTCWAPEGKPLACKPKDAPTNPNTPKQ
jgi:hypothetical protein